MDKPIFISSGYRSKALNEAIGGSKTSQHSKGEAIDIDMDYRNGPENEDIFHYIRENLPFDQLIWEFGTDSRPDWVHVSYKKGGPQRGQILNSQKKFSWKNLLRKLESLIIMKSNTLFLAAAFSTTMSFICSYFLELYMGNVEQYLALIAVVFVDGFFGISAGIKREGFQTRKAVRVLQRAIGWVVFLTVILMVERGFEGTGWLSQKQS